MVTANWCLNPPKINVLLYKEKTVLKSTVPVNMWVKDLNSKETVKDTVYSTVYVADVYTIVLLKYLSMDSHIVSYDVLFIKTKGICTIVIVNMCTVQTCVYFGDFSHSIFHLFG